MAEQACDVLVITDPRFTGGTSSAVATDVRAFSQAGLKVCLHLIEANGYFLPDEFPNPKVVSLLDLENVKPVSAAQTVKAGIAFFHHPSMFERPVHNPITVEAEKSVVVTHQPLFYGNGAMTIDPFSVMDTIKKQFGV